MLQSASILRTWTLGRALSTSAILAYPRVNAVATLETSKPTNSLKPHSLSRLQGQFVTYKPITPSIRHLKRPYNPHLYPGRALNHLTKPERKRGGRNTTQGRITIRFRGGGHRRRLRLVDFKRINGDPHDVIRIEYDPGRSGHIALLKKRVQLKPGVAPTPEDLQPFSYILACDGLKAGDVVRSFRLGVPEEIVPGYREMMEGRPGEHTDSSNAAAASTVPSLSTATLAMGMLRAATLKPGNVLPLHLVPTGTQIHNIALDPNGPGILVRSAGAEAHVVGHEENGKYTHVSLYVRYREHELILL
jgi:ribosomal protein L2